MKNILNYYYQIIVDDNKISDNGYFTYNNHFFCLYKYHRNINEIDALALLNKLMIERQVSINKIIYNNLDQVITYHNNHSYVLIMINYEYVDKANLKYIEAFYNHQLDILKRNDWGRLWSIKIDYIEYQLKHLKNSYPLINASVNYYIGLTENAISYFNMLNLSNQKLYIGHRRISNSNMFNPCELVIDYKVRDIAEYLKNNFINEKMTIDDIKDYINKINLTDVDYILLYVRMLYPSFYFDLYEEIINDNKKEEEITKITNLVNKYEELLYEIYMSITKKVNIIGIEWINRKYM